MFAVLMVALAMTGVAYACWSQTLYIHGVIQTGTLCVGFVGCDNSDNEYLDKDIGHVCCRLEGLKGTHGADNCYENLIIELENVYPGYYAEIEIEVANCGTIPVNIVDADIYPVSDPDNLLDFVDWWLCGCNWPGFPQLDPCENASFTICIEILQDVGMNECPQNATATFEGYIEFVQWNCEE